MLLKFYKSNVSVSVLLLPFLAIIISASIFLQDFNEPKLVFDWQNDILKWVWGNKLINFALTLIMLLANVLIINKSFNKTIFFSKVTYVPALVYLILYSFSQSIGFSPNLLIHLLTILLFNQLFLLDQNTSGIHHIFISGLLVGLIIAIAPYYVPLALIVFIALLIVRPYVWREWIGGLLGLAVPLIWYLSLKLIITKTLGIDFDFGQFRIVEQYQLIHYLQLLFLLLIILVSLVKLKLFHSNSITIVKKQVLILANYSVLVLFAFLLSYFTFGQFDFTGIIALSYIVVIGSLNDKSDTFISLILTIALVINIINLFI